MVTRENETGNGETSSLVEEGNQSMPSNHQKKYPGLGTVFGALSGIFYALCSMLIRLLSNKISPELITLCRSVEGFVFILPYVIYKRYRIFNRGSKNSFLLSIVGLLSVTVTTSQYYVFQMIHLSDANAILSTSCAIVAVITCIFHCRLCSLIDTFAVISCILGVFLCCQPSFLFGENSQYDAHYYLGLGIAMSTAILWAVSYLTLNAIKNETSVKLLATAFVSMIPLLIYTLITKSFKWPSTLYDNILLQLNTLLSFISLYFLMIGIEYDNALTTSIGKTADIFVSMLFDVLVFGDVLTIPSICGALIVIGSITVFSAIKLWRNRADYYGH